MYNGNTYKRFCTIMISLGVILSVGQFSYAHSPQLKAAKRAANENPTKENLGRLYNLYKQDVQEHLKKGEENEAKKSEAFAAWIDASLASTRSKETPTPENLENEARCWDKAADCFNSIAFYSRAKKARAHAAWARAKKADSIANNNATLDNWKNSVKCWERAASWFKSTGNLKYVQKCKMNHYEAIQAAKEAAWARAKKADSINDTICEFSAEQSLINWENVVKLEEAEGNTKKATLARAYESYARAHYEETCKLLGSYSQKYWEDIAKDWDDAAECCKKAGCILGKDARFNAAYARLRQAEMIAENNQTQENSENVAMCYETLAELEEKSEKFTYAASFRVNAAHTRLRQAEMIAKNEPDIESFENVAMCWGNMSMNLEALAEAEEAENRRADLDRADAACAASHRAYAEFKAANAASHRADAAQARAKQASIIADNNDTIKNCENAERLWNEAAVLFEAAGKKEKADKAREKARLESERKDNAIAYEKMVYFLVSGIQ